MSHCSHHHHHRDDRHHDGHNANLELSGNQILDPQGPLMAAFGRQSHTSPHPANVHESPTSQDNPGTPTDHTSALLTVIGGDAYAAGLSTDASGTVNNTVNDFGNVTVASGYAVFEATATSPAGDAAAGADTFVSVAGADIVMVFEFDMSFKVGNTVVAVSETSYLAIDIENWSRPNGPLVMDFQGHAALGHHGPEGPHLIPGPSFPSGNLAQVAAVADAHGPNTLASTLTQALTIENHFSYVNGMAIAAA